MKIEKQLEYSDAYYKHNMENRIKKDPNFLAKNDFVLSFFFLDPNFFYVHFIGSHFIQLINKKDASKGIILNLFRPEKSLFDFKVQVEFSYFSDDLDSFLLDIENMKKASSVYFKNVGWTKNIKRIKDSSTIRTTFRSTDLNKHTEDQENIKQKKELMTKKPFYFCNHSVEDAFKANHLRLTHSCSFQSNYYEIEDFKLNEYFLYALFVNVFFKIKEFHVDDYLFLVKNKKDIFIETMSLDFISEKNSELMKQLFEFDENERLTETSKNKIKAMKNI